jgi:DNA polymerase I-like protein with 3'-5' exonuclease and polymerase domains
LPLVVHDEGDLSVPKGGAQAFIADVERMMEDAVPLLLPVVAEAKVGRNWGDVSAD